MKNTVIALLILLSGCTSVSMMRNGISSSGKYIIVNTNKAEENRLLIEFSKDKLLVKNMKNVDDTSITPGESNVYSVNDYIVRSGNISFRVKATEPCQIALTNNKHPFFLAASTDRENKNHCSIRYMANLKNAEKVQ